MIKISIAVFLAFENQTNNGSRFGQMPIAEAEEQKYCVMTQGISREVKSYLNVGISTTSRSCPGSGAEMKRASAESAPLGNDSGLATRRAEHTGLRPEDAALLSKFRLNVPPAIETLFGRYHEKVYGLAMSILMNRNDAEEATQDVFLAVMRKADRFQEDLESPSWIYRIRVNTCLMRMRKGRRTETVPIEEFLPAFTEGGAYASSVEDWSSEVERQIPEKEIGQVIGGFAEELTEKYRLVFALCDLQGFSHEETAKVLGLSIAAVNSRLHRARLYLRERLSRYHRNGRSV